VKPGELHFLSTLCVFFFLAQPTYEKSAVAIWYKDLLHSAPHGLIDHMAVEEWTCSRMAERCEAKIDFFFFFFWLG